jgi:hypothetical protein
VPEAGAFDSRLTFLSLSLSTFQWPPLNSR